MERKPRSDGRETREALLAAAEEEFAAVGFESASVRNICRRANANCALANRYFGSKEELYAHVARRLFGELGAPLAALPHGVSDAESWRRAVTTWIDDFLFMTIPTERAQRLCAGLFKHEVTHPTSFHAAFERDFGKPVYDSLRALLAMAVLDERERAMWTASVWAQVSVYALADAEATRAFRSVRETPEAFRARVRDFICSRLFAELAYIPARTTGGRTLDARRKK